jgi:hypothetical protein
MKWNQIEQTTMPSTAQQGKGSSSDVGLDLVSGLTTMAKIKELWHQLVLYHMRQPATDQPTRIFARLGEAKVFHSQLLTPRQLQVFMLSMALRIDATKTKAMKRSESESYDVSLGSVVSGTIIARNVGGSHNGQSSVLIMATCHVEIFGQVR